MTKQTKSQSKWIEKRRGSHVIRVPLVLFSAMILAVIGLILLAVTYKTFHPLSSKMDPINYVNKDTNIQHGIPPKPPNIKPERLDRPALQENLPPRYPKYPQKLPKKVGGGNYELL